MQKVTMEWLYSLLALLLYLCFVHSCSGETGRETVVVFEDSKTGVFEKGDGKALKKLEPVSFGVSAFVGGMVNSKEFFAVLCDAHYGGSSDTAFIKPAVTTSYGGYKQWSNANLIASSIEGDKQLKSIGKVTAVMNKDKMYVLTTGVETSGTLEFKTDGTTVWDSLMIVGTIEHSTELAGDGGVTITWGNAKSLKSLLNTAGDAEKQNYFVGGMGNGVIMKNGTIVLPIDIKYKNSKHDAATIIYSNDGETWHRGKRTVSGTSQGSVVEFGEGKLLLSVQFSGGVRAVYESNNMGDTWKYSQTFMAVWGNQADRNAPGSQGSVITAPVDGKDVLLFAHPLNTDDNGIRDTLQLWVSDGQRIACVGTISETEKGKHTGNSILAYIDNKLYITHEISSYKEKEGSNPMTKLRNVIAVTPLDDYFERAKKTVLEWRALDKKITELGDISVDGLVGYWGNTTEDDNVWTDNYNCVNATVKGATRVQGGFRFSGTADSGAKWPVASQGQNQLYKFTRRQFTFAVTVQSNYTRGTEDVILLGARNNTPENTILFAIGYTHDKKWYTLDDKGTKHITNTLFEQNKKYHIALTFENGIVSFYVDLFYIQNEILIISPTSVIKEFFIGSIGTPLPAQDSFCTVKNVMLFNRYLQESDIARLYRVSKNGNLDEPMEIAEPAPPPATRQSVQTTAAATAPEKDHSVQTKKTTTLPVSHKTQSTTTPKQTSMTDKQTIHNANEQDKHLDHASREQVDATLKKKINHTDSSEVSFGFLQLMFVVCSIFLLVQF